MKKIESLVNASKELLFRPKKSLAMLNRVHSINKNQSLDVEVKQVASKASIALMDYEGVYQNEEFIKFREHQSEVKSNVENGVYDKYLFSSLSSVSIELSNLCNYSFFHKKCPASFSQEKLIMPLQIVEKIFNELCELKYKGNINFNLYNEPLMDPRLFKILEMLKLKCPEVTISFTTNGYYLNEIILSELYEYGVTAITVSAYTIKEFQRLVSYGTAIQQAYHVFFSILDDRINRYDGSILNCKIPCTSLLTDFSIYANGDVCLCCLDWKHQHVFGNVYKENIKDILAKELTTNIFEQLLKGNRNIELCKRCDWSR